MGDKIKLTQKGYDEYLKRIESYRDELTQNNKDKSSSYMAETGNGWHDNYDFEESKRKELAIMKKINDAKASLKNIEIIVEKSRPNNLVNIDDIIEVKMIYENGSSDNDKFKLIGGSFPEFKDAYDEVSLNSAIGSILYKAKIGSQVSYNTAEGKKIVVEILSKIGSDQ